MTIRSPRKRQSERKIRTQEKIFILARFSSDGEASNILAFDSKAEADQMAEELNAEHAGLGFRFCVQPLKMAFSGSVLTADAS